MGIAIANSLHAGHIGGVPGLEKSGKTPLERLRGA
jgi:hypothetical protein